MKLTISNFFNEYCNELNNNLKNIKLEIENFNKSKEYFLEAILPFETYIDNFTNINLESIKTSIRQIPPSAIITTKTNVGIDLNYLKYLIISIITINKTLRTLNTKLKVLENSHIKKEVFKGILYKFNNKISDKIIYKGYEFYMGFGLSRMRIKKIACERRKKKNINWFESNKIKKEIQDRGGLPYAVIKRDEQKRKLADNGGEKWFVYFNNVIDYLWNWNKGNCTITNTAYYKFRPTCYNNSTKNGSERSGNVNKLKQLVLSDSPLLKNYN